MDALGAFNAAPHIGFSMLKLGEDAVTIDGETAVAGTFSVGVRPPIYRKGAIAFLAASDGRGSPLQLGVVFAIAASV